MIADAAVVGSFRVGAPKGVVRNEHQLSVDDEKIGMARIASDDGMRPGGINQAAVWLRCHDLRVVVEEIKL